MLRMFCDRSTMKRMRDFKYLFLHDISINTLFIFFKIRCYLHSYKLPLVTCAFYG